MLQLVQKTMRFFPADIREPSHQEDLHPRGQRVQSPGKLRVQSAPLTSVHVMRNMHGTDQHHVCRFVCFYITAAGAGRAYGCFLMVYAIDTWTSKVPQKMPHIPSYTLRFGMMAIILNTLKDQVCLRPSKLLMQPRRLRVISWQVKHAGS